MNGKNRKKEALSFCSFFPKKSDTRKRVLYKLISLASIVVFAGCAVWLANEYFIEPRLADQAQQDLKNIYYSNSSPSGRRQSADTRSRILNLQKINPDIVGWISIPNTIIDLPVVQAKAENPDFYLTHSYDKKYSVYGTVYADCHSLVANPGSKSIILYGHSLISGRMFTQLKNFKSLDFYRTAPVFSFDTKQGHFQWKILSVFITNTLPQQGKPFDYMKTSFSRDSDYLNFVYQLRIRSLYHTGVSFNAKDKILLLSTCSYEFQDFREVVAARMVRAGESVSAENGQAAYNSKVLYPDCWYRKYGGKKPDWPATYEQAKKENLLTWEEQ